MASKLLPVVPPGQDALKGSIFFGNNLTPAGTFKNTPLNVVVAEPSTETTERLKKTLAVFAEELQKATAQQQGVDSSNPLSQQSINTYLQTFVELLIDYSDLRNFVFFGSAYTELAYNVNYLLVNYPFAAFIARDVFPSGSLALDLVSKPNSQTSLRFRNTDILQSGKLSFDLSGNTIWQNYNILDANNTFFPIQNFGYAEYTIIDVTPATLSTPILVRISFPTNPPIFLTGDTVVIKDVIGVTPANGTFTVGAVTTTLTYVEIELAGTINLISLPYVSGGILTNNNIVDILVDGVVSINNTFEYRPTVGVIYRGLLLSQSIQALNDFNTSITPIQKELLDLMNPWPWPRSPITNNIVYEGAEFDNWVTSENNLVSGFDVDELGFINDTSGGFNLVGALSLDETKTNQLLRRAIPEAIVNELNETEQQHFTKLILVASKYFDTLKVYIDFLKYTKTLNYGKFNQLSPDFYKQYAKHYGFDLYDDENISYSKSVVLSQNLYGENLTLQQLQQEKQKQLLINLFYLYSKKGTQAAIKYLTSLLGAPKGLMTLDEFAFDNITGTRIVDNDKVHVPGMNYILNTATDQYELILDNENTINLREITLGTDVTQSQIDSILEFGKTEYPFGHFNVGAYATLQNNNTLNPKGYLLLPLTFPDKYTGITVEYMIPKGGYIKGVGQGFDESSIHLASLYSIGQDVVFDINNEPVWLDATDRFTYELPPIFNESLINFPNTYLPIRSTMTFEIVSLSTLNDSIELQLDGNTFIQTFWKGTLRETALAIQRTVNKTYSPEQYELSFRDLGDSIELTLSGTDIDNGLAVDFYTNGLIDSINVNNTSNTLENGVAPLGSSNSFLIARLEGKDLVVRAKILNEDQSGPQQRVAIFNDLFREDGLIHKLRLLYRPEGVEVHQDGNYIGLARWRDPSTALNGPFFAIDIPQSEIETCDESSFDTFSLFAYPINDNATNDKEKWWDLFVGLPVNINFLYKKVAIFEAPSIDHPDSLDFGKDLSGLEVEKFNFDFRNQPTKTDGTYVTDSFTIACEFRAAFPVAPDPTVATDDISLYLTNISVNGLILDLNLINQTYQGGTVRHLVDRQDWFKVNGQQIYNLDTLFANGVYSPTLHKDYNYEPWYRQVLENYIDLSNNVYTYLALLIFVDSVEARFRPMTRQFIPIVININNFAKLLKSLEKHKVRYVDIHKTCEVNVIDTPTLAGTRFLTGTANIANTFQADISIPLKVEGASNSTPIIIYCEEHEILTGETITIEDVLGNTAANGVWTVTKIDENQFSLDTSVGNADYIGGGTAYRPIYATVGPITSVGSPITDATNLANAINIAWTDFNAVTNDEIIIFNSIDTIAFDQVVASFSKRKTLPVFKIVVTGNVTVANTFGMTSYTPPHVGGCFEFERTQTVIPILVGEVAGFIYYDLEQRKLMYVWFDGDPNETFNYI